MSVEEYPGPSQATVSGTGPYPIGAEYTEGAIVAVVVADGVETTLDAADYTVSPVAGTNGDVTLTSEAAALHDGATLYLLRDTALEQGWLPVFSPRENGLAAQLDRQMMALQENRRQLSLALRVSRVTDPVNPLAATAAARASRLVQFSDDGLTLEAGQTTDDIAGQLADILEAYNSILAAAVVSFPFDCGLVSDGVIINAYDMGSV